MPKTFPRTARMRAALATVTLLLPALLAAQPGPPAPPPRPADATPSARQPALPLRNAPNEAAILATAPAVPREFRAAWIVTVGNGDWPSKPGLSTWQQQQELLAILNRAKELGLNAVVLQVRPGADAFYASRYEPWSHYLTGRQGRAPDPYYDPLRFAVEAAHERGLELHAWFNPFRAIYPKDSVGGARTSVVHRRPDLVRRYGPYYWMDPGLAEVRKRAVRAIMDVVTRYDVDGVHIDDYFYPYQERAPDGRVLEFPDQRTYRAYRKHGGRLDKDDWRRHNVDLFIKDFYASVKRAKPWVKVGISPFGIWRPGNPPEVHGMDAYTEIYADSRRWLREGWLDYVAPQLYWRSDAPQQPYVPLLDWWVGQNVKHRHVWPGLYTGHVAMTGAAEWPAAEILHEIDLTRAEEGATGNIHFPMKTLLGDPDSLGTLLAAKYAEPALIPASPWLDAVPPARPKISVVRDSATGDRVLRLTPVGEQKIWHWTVRTHVGDGWKVEVLPGWMRKHILAAPDSAGVGPDLVYVTAVDRVGNESKGVSAPVPLPPPPPAPPVVPDSARRSR